MDNQTGMLAPGEEIVHELNFNTAGLENGIYTADIMINSNENSLIIPVELFVDMGIIEYGDIDDNGDIDSFDSSLILQYIVGLDPQGAPLPWEIWRSTRADVDGNGIVEAYDSGLILQYVVGMIDEFPVEQGRDHIAPYGEVDVRVNSESGSWLEFYVRGEVYSLEVMSRTHDFVLGEAEVPEGTLSAYNNASEIYRYALAGYEPLNRAVCSLRIPVQGHIYSGELELYLKVNGYEFEETILLGDNGGVVPVVSELSGNYPNPFNPETTIEYSLAVEDEVEISIYNIRGQQVKTLIRARQDAGHHQVVWDGRDSSGHISSSGAYIYLMRTSTGVQTKKMILLK